MGQVITIKYIISDYCNCKCLVVIVVVCSIKHGTSPDGKPCTIIITKDHSKV